MKKLKPKKCSMTLPLLQPWVVCRFRSSNLFLKIPILPPSHTSHLANFSISLSRCSSSHTWVGDPNEKSRISTY